MDILPADESVGIYWNLYLKVQTPPWDQWSQIDVKVWCATYQITCALYARIFNKFFSFMPLILDNKYCTMLHLFDDLWLDKIIPKNNDRKESLIWKSREYD
jgi:hypothetical protein